MSTGHVDYLFFLKRPRKMRADGQFFIYLRITFNDVEREISTGKMCHPDQWMKSARKLAGRTEYVRTMNDYLESFYLKAIRIEREINKNGEELTADKIKTKFLGKDEIVKWFVPVFQEHNDNLKKLVAVKQAAEGTLTNYKTTLTHLKSFLQHQYKSTDIDVRKIDLEFINSFDFYLRTEPKLSNNTTLKNIGNLGKVIRICIRKKFTKDDPFLGYEEKRKSTVPTFLDHDELMRIVTRRFSNERLEKVRLVFLFACYTGFAYAEVKGLKKNNLIREATGTQWLMISRKKNSSPERIPLLTFAARIIDLFKEDQKCAAVGTLLAVSSNQKVNEYLKEIATLCDISKDLTFHVARHTFATTVALSNDLPIETVRKILGHSTVKMTEHYARIIDVKVRRDMQALQSRLDALEIGDPLSEEAKLIRSNLERQNA